MPINDYDNFDDTTSGSHGYSYDNNIEIKELYIIPTHVRSIEELLFDKERLEYYLTHNVKTIIDIITNYELLEVDFVAS